MYAARDYYAVNFTTGLVRPNAGDVMFIGANLGAATWTGTVAKVVVTSGGWTSDLAGTGDAAGLFMVYNTTGTLTNASINNSTQGSVASMTGTGNNTASQAAGLYVATGTRGATTALASWQWCDLGYNIQYDTGIAAFQNQNTSATAAAQAAKYVTTAWKTATTPTTAAGRGQWLSVGTAYPLNLSDNDTANYVDHTFNTTPTTGLLQLTGFGFTNADIPSSASITGIEIQIYRAATGLTGNYTSDVIDKTLQLVNVANVKNPPNLADTTNNWGVVAKSAPITADTYILKDYGAPSAVPLTPTSLMGYDGITATDITSANFGINFNCQLSGSTTG